MPSGVGTMIDRAASLQPARAPKQQIPLAPCKGRGRFPAHEEDRVCLPSGSVGSILGKATSTTDYRNTVNQTNKQTNRGRDGGTHWRRGDSGLNQARKRNVRDAQQGSEAFVEQRRPQEPAVMCGQEGRNAARVSCTQRRHKDTRRRSSDRLRTG